MDPRPSARPLGIRRRLAAAARAAGLLLALIACAGCGQAARPPNVLLIVVDTVRTDHLSAYGYPWETTPRLDALARTGVLFSDCTAQSSWTMPSMISLMTGRSIFRSIYKVPEQVPLLAESFQAAGYVTGGFVANSVLAEEAGFGRGLDAFDVRERNKQQWKAHDVNRKALKFLDRLDALGDGDAPPPFFLWLHYLDPHAPYTPPRVPWTRSFDELFEPFEQQVIADGVESAPPEEQLHLSLQTGLLADEVDRYDGELLTLDGHIGRVLDALQAQGLADDTLVVVVGDHGETLFRRPQHVERTEILRAWRGEHDMAMQLEDYVKKEHNTYLYEELVRTPFIIAGPGIAGPRVCDAMVSNLDLFPTLLGLCGLSSPGLEGRDLSAALRSGAPVPDAAFVTAASDAMLTAKLPDGRKLIAPHPERIEHFGDAIELFDLQADPFEQHPLPLDDEARALLERLREAHRNGPFVGWSDEGMDAETVERLRELGYIR